MEVQRKDIWSDGVMFSKNVLKLKTVSKLQEQKERKNKRFSSVSSLLWLFMMHHSHAPVRSVSAESGCLCVHRRGGPCPPCFNIAVNFSRMEQSSKHAHTCTGKPLQSAARNKTLKLTQLFHMCRLHVQHMRLLQQEGLSESTTDPVNHWRLTCHMLWVWRCVFGRPD